MGHIFTLLTFLPTIIFSKEKQEEEKKAPPQEEQQQDYTKPLYGPDNEKGGRFGYYLYLDGLYWQATETGIPFAVEDKAAAANATNAVTKLPSFKWRFGFKIGVGSPLFSKGWDLAATWTHYDGKGNGTATRPAGGQLIPIWSYSTDSAETASASLGIGLDIIDINASKGFFLDQGVLIQPYFGIRSARIVQNYHINYQGDAITQPEDIVMKNDCVGIGVLGGLYSGWTIVEGLDIFGNASFSILSSKFHISKKLTLLNGTVQEDQKTKMRPEVSVGDFALGLAYTSRFAITSLVIRAAWETHMFFGQNQFNQAKGNTQSLSLDVNEGNLGTHGVSFSIRYDF